MYEQIHVFNGLQVKCISNLQAIERAVNQLKIGSVYTVSNAYILTGYYYGNKPYTGYLFFFEETRTAGFPGDLQLINKKYL